MPQFLTLKESLQELKDTETMFAPTVKAVLQLWLEAADKLPRHLQHPSTATTTQLASVALQQGRLPMEWDDPRLAAWLEEHLPGISTAMQDSISTQLGISTRRASILKGLVAGRQQPSDRDSDKHLLQRVQAETDLYRQLGHLVFVFLFISPIATLCQEVAEHDKRSKDGTHKQRCTDQQHPGVRLSQHSNRLHQGYSLIFKVAQSLGDLKGAVQQLHKDMDKLNRCLRALCRTVTAYQATGAELLVPAADAGAQEVQGSQAETKECVARDNSAYQRDKAERKVWVSYASNAWMSLLVRLPPVSDVMVNILHHIDWHLLTYGLTREEAYNEVRPALCRLLARPDLRSGVLTMLSPEGLREVLRNFGVKPQHLQIAGLPTAVAQQLLSVPEGTPFSVVLGVVDRFGIRFCRPAGPQSPGHGNSAQGSGHDGSGRGPADGIRSDAGQDGDLEDVGDLNDMEILLRQMYGTSL